MTEEVAVPGIERAREETSLLSFFSILLRSRRVIALSGLVGVIAFGAVALSEANLYVATGAFVVRASRTPSHIPDVAAQIGLTLGVIDIAHTTMFFAELARANSVLTPVAAKTYTVTTSQGTKSGPLAQFLGISAANPASAAILAAKELPDRVAVLTSGRTGVVKIFVTENDPQIAQQVATNILRELDHYSTSSRGAQALAERKFVETLVAESREKLLEAENRLSRFRQQNRQYESSPQLKIEDDQLNRDVDLQLQDYKGLESSYQQARIEEVRNLSAISIVEYPDVPVEPQRSEAARKTLIGLVTGLLAGIVLAFMRARLQEKRRDGDASLDDYHNAQRDSSAEAGHLRGQLSRSSAEL